MKEKECHILHIKNKKLQDTYYIVEEWFKICKEVTDSGNNEDSRIDSICNHEDYSNSKEISKLSKTKKKGDHK